jgi:hypothetical protein
MKMSGAVTGAALAAALILSATAWAQTAAPMNQLSAAETAAGWKLLFDGKGNTGWIKPDGAKGGFVLEDSALKTHNGDICTQGDYDHFELALDYKYNTDGNSGVFLHTKRGMIRLG